MLALLLLGGRGDLIGGWALDKDQILRKRIRVRGDFRVCSLVLVAALSVPRAGGTEAVWMNGLYEAFCVIVVFPQIVTMGAGSMGSGMATARAISFFGVLPYPLYITHYPLFYIYTGWVVDGQIPPERGALVGLGVLIGSIALALAALKLIDEPARRWLAARFLRG